MTSSFSETGELSYPDPEEVPSANYPWYSAPDPLQDKSWVEGEALPHLGREGNYPVQYQNNISDGSHKTDSLPQTPGGVQNAVPLAQVHQFLEAADPDFRAEEDYSASEDGFISDDEEARHQRPAKRGRGRPRGSRGRRGGRGGQAAKALSSGTAGRRRGRPRKNEDEDPRGGWSKGLKVGPRKALEPSEEFKDLHQRASMAFVEGDYDASEDLVSQAIILNPEVFAAHSLLSEIYLNKGDLDRAVIALFHGAHTRHRDPDIWTRCAQLITERAGEELPRYISDVIYCYGRVLSFERDNFAVRKRRAALHRQIKALPKAVSDYQMMLRQKPLDVETLQDIAEVCLELKKPLRAISAYDNALSHFFSSHEIPPDGPEWAHVSLYAELLIQAKRYRTGLAAVKKFARWMLGRHDEDFWDKYLLDDREMDFDDEPRRTEVHEFHLTAHDDSAYGAGIPLDLRIKIGLMRLQLGPEHFEEAMSHFQWLHIEDEEENPIAHSSDLFVQVADGLFATEHFREAMPLFESLRLAACNLDNERLKRLAVCYEKLEMYEEAEEIYLAISEQEPDDLNVIEKLAKMFGNANLSDRAEPYMQRLMIERNKKLRAAEVSLGEASNLISATKASRVPAYRRGYRYILPMPASSDEGLGSSPDLSETEAEREVDGLPLALSASRERVQKRHKKDRKDGQEPARGLQGTRPRIAPRMKRQLDEVNQDEVRNIFAELEAKEASSLRGPGEDRDEWHDLSSRALQVFTEQIIFYPSDKHQRFWGYTKEARAYSQKSKADQELLNKELKAGRLSRATAVVGNIDWKVPADFCGIPFARWLDTFLQKALFLAAEGKSTEAYATCQFALDSNVFYHSAQATRMIQNTRAACAVTADDEETLSDVARHFMKEEQYLGDSYRFYGALNLSTRLPNDTFNSSLNQKFILRQIKAMDWALMSADERERRSEETSGRATYSRINPDTGEAIVPKKLSIELLMLYAQMLYANSSHIEALAYLYRAWALASDSPMVNLVMALSYIGWSFKRLAANRHYQIVEGLALLHRYYDLRKESSNAIDRQEAEFNVGRTYHMLGLTHLSVPYYERCIKMAETNKLTGNEENFAVEAAFALQAIWSASGQLEQAERVTEEWLSM